MNERQIEFSEKDCLAFDPFADDFGSPGDRIIKNKMVTARKGGKCDLCRQDIRRGERIRVMAGIFDDELLSHRWCHSCCEAMAKSWTDGCDAYEERAEIGRKQWEVDHEHRAG